MDATFCQLASMDFPSNVTCPFASSAANVDGSPLADMNAATSVLMVLTLTVVLIRVSTMLIKVSSEPMAIITMGGVKEGTMSMLKEPSVAVRPEPTVLPFWS